MLKTIRCFSGSVAIALRSAKASSSPSTHSSASMRFTKCDSSSSMLTFCRPFLGKKRYAFVQCYPVKPCRQFGIPSEILNRLPCLHKRVLQNIRSIFMALHHTADLPIDRLRVDTHNLIKRLPALLRMPEPLNQLLIFLG